VADGIRYLEVRFSPILHIQSGMSLSQVMEAICEGQAMAELNLPITVRIIVCGMRQMHSRYLSPYAMPLWSSPLESVTEKLAEIAWRYQDKGVAAFGSFSLLCNFHVNQPSRLGWT
jgi:adenosine deaminase